MLIEFSVQNYRSIFDKLTLSFVAYPEKSHLNNLVESDIENLSILKSLAIFGANGSGKTSILRALADMIWMMKLQDGTAANLSDYLKKRSYFKFDLLGKQTPAEFGIVFPFNGIRHQYGFSFNDTRILQEWLYVYPKGRVQKWFEREYLDGEYHYKFSEKYFKGSKSQIKDLTKEDSLYFTVGRSYNNQQLIETSEWFKRSIYPIFSLGSGEPSSLLEGSPYWKTMVVNLLKGADIDLEDIQILRREEKDEGFTKYLRETNPHLLLETNFLHRVNDSEEMVALGLNDESTGTLRLYHYAPLIINALNNGGVIIIDEMDNSFHPLLTKYVLNLFHNPYTNKKNAQLLFTTHDTSILSKEVFRRDQVWFVEKDAKRTSKLSSLLDVAKKDEGFQSGYLLGKYGAIPNL